MWFAFLFLFFFLSTDNVWFDGKLRILIWFLYFFLINFSFVSYHSNCVLCMCVCVCVLNSYFFRLFWLVFLFVSLRFVVAVAMQMVFENNFKWFCCGCFWKENLVDIFVFNSYFTSRKKGKRTKEIDFEIFLWNNGRRIILRSYTRLCDNTMTWPNWRVNGFFFLAFFSFFFFYFWKRGKEKKKNVSKCMPNCACVLTTENFRKIFSSLRFTIFSLILSYLRRFNHCFFLAY